ncbi:MAG TPA: tetratricopeptide repeat protein [Pyrinomonadaceae bacterium]|nr:tetratricopeptide repeat protein [Pyrinomonadaceae bacterium]
MSVQDSPLNLEDAAEPDDLVIRRLVRAIDYAEGFWLGFAKSNTPAQRRRLAALCKDLLESLKIRVLEIELNEPVTDLLPVLRERLTQEANNEEAAAPQPKLAIFVHGLERSIPSREAYPPLLSALNLKRELFRQEVPHPLLLWLPDYALTALARKAPDLWAWRSGLYEFAPERETTEQSLKAVRGEAVYVTDSLSEPAKRERLVMLKGLLDDYRELGNTPHEQEAIASILNEIGLTHETLGEWTEARESYKKSRTISRNIEDDAGEAIALHNLGRIEQAQGELDEARRLFSESLNIERKLGDERGVAYTSGQLGNLALIQGDFEEAGRLYKESLALSRKLADQSCAAIALHNLAIIAQAHGESDEARKLYNESLDIKKRLGNHNGVAVTLQEMGRLSQTQGKLDEARRLYNESLNIRKRIGDIYGIAVSLHQLGRLAEAEGDTLEAGQLFQEAVNIFEELGSPNANIARRSLARIERHDDVSD